MDQQARTGAQLRSLWFSTSTKLSTTSSATTIKTSTINWTVRSNSCRSGCSNFFGLGQLGQQMGVQDVNTLLGIGGLQQQQGQRELDVARANQLAQQALPFQRIGFMSDIFRGVPALQQTYSTTTTPPPSRTSQLLGLGIAGLGAVGSAGGIGNLFNMGVRPT